jgi:hypothetical protein
MFCLFINAAMKRYFVRFGVSLLLYAVSLVLSVLAFVHFRPTGVVAYILAVLPALFIVAQIAAFALYLSEEKDEFVRNLQIESMLWGIGATLSATTIWGFLQSFVHVHPLDLILVYPLYCALSGVSYAFVNMRYK